MDDNWQRYAAAALTGLLANSNNLTTDATPAMIEHLASEAEAFADKLADIEKKKDHVSGLPGFTQR